MTEQTEQTVTEVVETVETPATQDAVTTEQETPAAVETVETKEQETPAPTQETPPAQETLDPVEQPKDDKQTESLKEDKTKVASLTQAVAEKEKAVTGLSKKVETFETALKEVVAEKLSSFSKEVAALLPDGSPVEQLEWLKKAEAAGIQKPAAVGSPIPSAASTTGSDAVEYNSPTQRLSAAFGKRFKK